MFDLIPFYNRKNNAMKKDGIFDIRSMFNDFFNEPFFSGFFFGGNSMRADIKENDKEYILEMEIPGVRKEDIKLDLMDDVLTVSVNNNEAINEEHENYIIRERRMGSYVRNFHVGNIKRDEVTAKYDKGILTVTLPKEIPGKSRGTSIEIH